MYKSTQYVYEENRPVEITIRNYTEKDFSDMIRIQSECFPPPFPEELWWDEEQLSNHVLLFPEGALCAEVDGRLVGSITGLRVKFDPEHPDHTWEEITDGGYIRNHEPEGDTLYIVDISVSPAYRKLGIGKLLMQAMYHTVVRLDINRLLGGSRMPGYHKQAGEMDAKEYVRQVVAGELRDPVVSFLLSCGRTPLHVIENYLEDEESKNCCVLMEWKNPFKQ